MFYVRLGSKWFHQWQKLRYPTEYEMADERQSSVCSVLKVVLEYRDLNIQQKCIRFVLVLTVYLQAPSISPAT